jgi:hypothetical protein
MKKIINIFCKIFVCILCIGCLCFNSFADTNIPTGDIGEFGAWITKDNMEIVNKDMSEDMTSFQNKFDTNLHSSDFVPLEVKIGLSFMKALSAIDYVLQLSLVRFTIIFLFIMYAFWVGLEAYKMIRESTDYKTVIYDIFKKGITIAVWVMVLNYGPAKIFTILISPILSLGTYISDFILSAVAETYNIKFPDTCATISLYVNANASDKLLVAPQTAANIMCLPARLSVYFYNAIGLSLNWILGGFGHSAAAVAMGIVSLYIFAKCILKYAFMTLGIVADLFLTLLMLPFTALAESMPTTKETNYAGQIFSGFLGVFNTKKLSEVISTFINTAIYFVSLAIVVGVAAVLLSYIVKTDSTSTYVVGSAMVNILCGALVLHIIDKADELAKDIGGSIDNSFGKKLQDDAKNIWNNTKKFAVKLIKEFAK